MTFTALYPADEPTLASISALPGVVVVEFGTPWCGYCIAAQPAIEAALSAQPQVRHIKVEDGRGRPLGRAFHVKLWPTLVYLEKGVEKGRVVRPENAAAIEGIFATTDGQGR